jgi:aspartate-semialdehyde dehydrogenase
MPSGRSNSSRVAVVGASSLRGKELVTVLEERHFPSSEIVLLDTSVPAGTLTEAAGEPTFIRALEEESFEGARFAFFAGAAQEAEQNWTAAQRSGATVIDLTGVLAAPAHPSNATAWIPSLASALPLPPPKKSPGGIEAFSSPNPPVIIACALAAALGKLSAQGISLLLFPPVSEHEQAGVEELEAQTAGLLSFREPAKPLFDAQLAFNLLPEYGPAAKFKLADARTAAAREAGAYLAGRAPIPAIQLVQAPVFYGYSFAAFAEFPTPAAAEQLHAAFANLGVRMAAPDDAPPSNASVTGEAEIQLARIAADPNVVNGVWIWGVADGLRLAATNAVQIAEEILAKSEQKSGN